MMTKNGQSTVVPARMVLHAADQFTPFDAVLELIENSIDAILVLGTKRSQGKPVGTIWVDIDEGRLTITDTGIGMIPWMPAEDRELLEAFLSDPTNTRFNNDPRTLMSTLGKSSLEYLIRTIGLSAKEGHGQLGRKGIGIWSILGCAQEATITSIAASQLSGKKNNGTFTLTPASRSMLEHYDMSYDISESSTLTTPWTKQLTNGTRIDLKLKAGVTFQPGDLALSLGSRYSGYIHNEGIQIIVIDRVTAAGKRTRGGKEIHVNPPKLLGIEVYRKTFHLLSGGKVPFDVHIRFDPNQVREDVQLRILGVDRGPVSNVPGLREFKELLSGHMTGYIELPDHESIPLNTAKTLPLETAPGLKPWVKKVQSTMPQIKEAADQLKARLGDKAMDRYAENAADAIQAALDALEAFEHTEFEESATKKSGRTKKKKPRQKMRFVMAAARNQRFKGLPNIEMLLLLDGKEYNRITTTYSGNANFGTVPHGRYTLRVVVPKNEVLISNQEVHFVIDEEHPGKNGVFVFQGEEPPKSDPTLRRIAFRVLPDTRRLYDATRINLGILILNLAADPIAEAYDLARQEGNIKPLDEIIAKCAGRALARHRFPDDTDLGDQMGIWLELVILQELVKTRRKRK